MKNLIKILLFAAVMTLMVSCTGKKNETEKTQESKTEQTQEGSQKETSEETDKPEDVQKESMENTGDDKAYEPVTVETYENTFTFDKVPERVVSLSFSETQLLVALGLSDKIVGIATAETGVDDCLPEYQEELSKLKVISDTTPTLEVLLENNPDFVVGTVYSFTEYGVAPSADFVKNNIPYYALRGTYVENAGIEDTYKDIESLGKIFHVEDRAEALVNQLKEREKTYMEATSDKKAKVFVYNSGDEKQAMTIGKDSLDEKILSLAGGENIFNDITGKRYSRVSWEEIAVRNPELILIYGYDAGNTAGTLDEKIKELKNNPALADVDAIKNDRFASVRLIEVFPGLQMFDAAEKIQKAIGEFK